MTNMDPTQAGKQADLLIALPIRSIWPRTSYEWMGTEPRDSVDALLWPRLIFFREQVGRLTGRASSKVKVPNSGASAINFSE